MLMSSGFRRKQILRSLILSLHCQTSVSRNKKEIHGLGSFTIPLFTEIQIDASVVFLAGIQNCCSTLYYKLSFSNSKLLVFLLKDRCFLTKPILKFRRADLLYKHPAED